MKNYLNFETDIKELETEIEKLKDPFNQSGVSEVDTQKISKIQSDLDEKLEMIYSNLDPWQTTMVARHEDRPKSKFFINNLFYLLKPKGKLILTTPNFTSTMFVLEKALNIFGGVSYKNEHINKFTRSRFCVMASSTCFRKAD